MKRIVYFDPVGRVFGAHEELIKYPPEGYEFVVNQTPWERKLAQSQRLNVFLYRVADYAIPVHLLRAYMNAWIQKAPPHADLTLAYNHLVIGDNPWVLWLETVERLAGFSIRHVKRFRRTIEKHLAADNCVAIVTPSEDIRKAVLLNLDCSKFEHKVVTVPLAVSKKDFIKRFDDGKIRLLFVSSDRSRSPNNFALKGGLIVLEAYLKLRQKYSNLEFIIRSDVPKAIKTQLVGLTDVRLIDEIVPWTKMDEIFRSADVFMYPAHENSWRVVLDAMSYELPVIATDVYAFPEKVQHGKTGFLVQRSKHVPYYGDDLVFSWSTSLRSKYEKAYKVVDPTVVADVVEKASIMIDNRELRRQMGRAGRWEIEHGAHSIETRNSKLKAIFDSAFDHCRANIGP